MKITGRAITALVLSGFAESSGDRRLRGKNLTGPQLLGSSQLEANSPVVPAESERTRFDEDSMFGFLGDLNAQMAMPFKEGTIMDCSELCQGKAGCAVPIASKCYKGEKATEEKCINEGAANGAVWCEATVEGSPTYTPTIPPPTY